MMLLQYLKLCSAPTTTPLPLQFFTERDISVQEWLARGWLYASPVGDSTPCRYCGDSVEVRLKRAHGKNVLSAHCSQCGSYELLAEETWHYRISAMPLINAIRMELNCRGELQQDGLASFSFLGHAAVAGQSRSVYFLPAINDCNANAVQSLLSANKLNMLFHCANSFSHGFAVQMPERQLFPLDSLLQEDGNGNILLDREQILLQLQPGGTAAPRKSPKKTLAIVVCAEKMKKELDAYFKDVYSDHCHAECTGVPPREFPRMTQDYLARVTGTYPAMVCRAIQRDPALRVMFKHANDYEYIRSYVRKGV